MSDKCDCGKKKQYSALDRFLNQPKRDRIEENYKSILARGNVEDDVVLIRGNQQEFIKGFREGAGLSKENPKAKEEINTTYVGSCLALIILGIVALRYIFG